jgi:signal transduction histidine kinase
LEAIANLTQPGMSMRGITLMKQLHNSLPPLSGDPGLLQQVFLNLVTNALDSMPEGGVITLATNLAEGSPPNGQSIEVIVRDNGKGMSDEVRTKAIEPFFTTKEPGKGAGLGLAICDEIIRSHHGKIEIESQEGEGSTIRVQLPVFPVEVR